MAFVVGFDCCSPLEGNSAPGFVTSLATDCLVRDPLGARFTFEMRFGSPNSLEALLFGVAPVDARVEVLIGVAFEDTRAEVLVGVAFADARVKVLIGVAFGDICVEVLT
jgi:hypothetical protein